jgi:hypothetical protein
MLRDEIMRTPERFAVVVVHEQLYCVASLYSFTNSLSHFLSSAVVQCPIESSGAVCKRVREDSTV